MKNQINRIIIKTTYKKEVQLVLLVIDLMAGFIYKLQNIVNITPNNSNTDINIARCLLKNLDKIKKKTSLQEISEICYTSPSSISRFCQKLGYTSFNDFKADYLGVQEELNETILDNSAFSKINISSFLNKINASFSTIDTDKLNQSIDKLCDAIHNSKRIFIFATHIPGDLANILQRALLTAGKYVEFYPRKEHQIELAKQIRQNDLCLFISLEGTLLMEKAITIPAIISLANNILITQNSQIKFSQQFNDTIVLGNHDDENLGKYKLLFFIDCLINQYYNKYVVKK
ncbi:MurR/RpiR family transcriptional regulator [Thomasclavelia sp.]|uniref:MurR/RpiR family transcriptional regulator n=1 Tax=Thomasclavelia sp. TaxID=3025757 RepID=UPI0025E37C99|nr:MurR/RpiR family transcriptional regulator [Thomasclavelia sp.]